MSNVIGVVETKSRNGKAIKVGGIWYSAYAASSLAAVNTGDNVSFEYVEKGEFKNIKGPVTKGTGSESVATTVTSGSALPTGYSKVPIDRDRSIIRQNALTNAREYFANGHGSAEGYGSIEPSTIIEVARIFESYTSGDADLELMRKKLSAMEVE